MSSDTTRPTLLSRLRDPRDDEAWREFEARYRDLVLRASARFGMGPNDGEDLHQLVLSELLVSLPRFRYDPSRGQFRHWLGKLVRRTAQRMLRERAARSRRLHGYADELDALVPSEEWEGQWEREWQDFHLRTALDRLRREFRPESFAVFETLLEGATVREAARVHGTSEPAVHKIRQRLLARVRAQVAKQIDDEELGEVAG